MNEPTINDAVTIAGGSTGTMLANRYRVVRQLGSGGMGSVWLVEDVKLDNKPFAVKMLPAILVGNKRAYCQLKDEALVAMKLTHPNIVTLRAFEENNGTPFLVMDYIDGQTLDDYLAEKGKLTEEETLRVLRPIAVALDYAHTKGVVHRDVKPGNVMIAKDGTPYILDFGIAREIQETMTRVTGKLSSGTLMYMSPEQNNGAEPTPAQDVYSFAAMAYECLAGKPPFTRGNIEYQIMNTPPAPLPPGGPHSCAAAIMAGLAKKPEDRPATCSAVLEGDDLSRKERKDRKDARPVATETGGSRSVATIRGSGVLAASSGRARSPSAPQGDENDRVEHVERVEGKARDDGEGKVSRRIGIWLVGLGWIAVIGGFWWGASTGKDKKVESIAPSKRVSQYKGVENIKPTRSERGVRRKVQLWEGGPYWACKNIGAEEPWESGYYFWWGDTVGYKRQGDAWVASDGPTSNFSFAEKNTPTYNKGTATLLNEGWITSDNILASEHDAAHVHWGGDWRMPTKQELQDLNEKCDWTWATMNRVNGYVVRGRGSYASAWIFLPAAGYGDGPSLYSAGSGGYYWSSVPGSDDYGAWNLGFSSSGHGPYRYDYRLNGQSVRPVQGFAK